MKTIKELEEFVKPFYAKRDPMHNFQHIKRIKRKVSKLKKQYKKIDKDLLNLNIYFHGSTSWAKKNKNKIISMGYPASYVNKINKLTTPEGKIVWDANCLENVGKFGITKTLRLEKFYKQSRKETLILAKKFLKKYKFYTPLGKKLGNPRIIIKKNWIERELRKLKKD